MPRPLRWSSTAVLASIILLATSVVVARAGHLYLGSGGPVWNNDGDTGTLIDPHNVAVSRYRY